MVGIVEAKMPKAEDESDRGLGRNGLEDTNSPKAFPTPRMSTSTKCPPELLCGESKQVLPTHQTYRPVFGLSIENVPTTEDLSGAPTMT